MLSFFGLQTVALLAPLYGPLALVMPYPHLPNIVERWVFQDPETLQRVAREFGGPVSPWISLLVIVGYCSMMMTLRVGAKRHRRRSTALPSP